MNGEKGYPHLFREKAFGFSPLNMMVIVGFL